MDNVVFEWPRTSVKLAEKEFAPISLCSPLCCHMPYQKWHIWKWWKRC